MKYDGRGNRKAINLALQGGGAHGAFAWGVLDRLLEDGRIIIEAISGTSAGAINAVVLADGFMRGGYAGARQSLHRFWKAASHFARFSPIRRGPADMLMGNWSLDASPAVIVFDLWTRLASPYDFNPLNLNPLKSLLERMIDFELVRGCEQIKIFISATNVETGRVTVFDRKQLTSDMVMASACLPQIFQAVEIDGVPYWDGGYMGNPVLYPFHEETQTRDYVIVQINPVERKGTPKRAIEILNRLNEITFNSSLLQELRAIDFVSRLLDAGKLDPAEYKHVNVHTIEAYEELRDLGAASKLNAEWPFLRHLFRIGRGAAGRWLDVHFAEMGVKSTADLRAIYQGGAEDREGTEDRG